MLKHRQSGHGFQGGAGRVETLQRLVEHWNMVVRVQHLPFDPTDPVGEAVGVVARHRRHRQDVAGQAIEHYHRSKLQTKPPGGIIVQIDIDGQLDRFPRSVGTRC